MKVKIVNTYTYSMKYFKWHPLGDRILEVDTITTFFRPIDQINVSEIMGEAVKVKKYKLLGIHYKWITEEIYEKYN